MTLKRLSKKGLLQRRRLPTVRKAVYMPFMSEDASLEASDWALTGEQMLYLMQHNNMIVEAFAADDYEKLREFAASESFRSHFGSMGFDEAYDRYLTAIEEGRA